MPTQQRRDGDGARARGEQAESGGVSRRGLLLGAAGGAVAAGLGFVAINALVGSDGVGRTGAGTSGRYRVPDEVRRAPAPVREAYEFAIARPDVLQWMPCACGCGLTDGHRNNLDCYVRTFNQDGTVTLDGHGFT